jgi:hypothetical protein
VTCKPTTRTIEVNGHSRRVSTEQCTTKLVTAPVVFPSGSDVTATLSRSSVVYATGRGNNSRVELSARRTIKPGHYVLALRRGRSTTRVPVTIG